MKVTNNINQNQQQNYRSGCMLLLSQVIMK